MKKTTRTRSMAYLALLLAMGIVLNIIESLIPLPIPLPGVKLGLANLIGLVVLYFYSPKEYLLVGFLRVLLVGLLWSGIASYAFLLSLAGWFLSSLFVVLFNTLIRKASIFGLSIGSATFHCLGQIIVIMFLMNLPQMINYLPVLMASAVISGALMALVSKLAISIMQKTAFKNRYLYSDSNEKSDNSNNE